ncbi:ACT domain-containing protein [Acinetobacter baumannii]
MITALGADRPGIVNTITRHVSSCDCLQYYSRNY